MESNGQQQRGKGEKEAIELRSRKSQTTIQREKKQDSLDVRKCLRDKNLFSPAAKPLRSTDYKYTVGGKGGACLRKYFVNSGRNMRGGGIVLTSLAHFHRPFPPQVYSATAPLFFCRTDLASRILTMGGKAGGEDGGEVKEAVTSSIDRVVDQSRDS